MAELSSPRTSEVDQVLSLLTGDAKSQGLTELQDCLRRSSFMLFLGKMKDLFAAVRLALKDEQMEIVLQCTQMLTDQVSSVCADPDAEVHFKQLLPAIVENLGNPKVRNEQLQIVGGCTESDP